MRLLYFRCSLALVTLVAASASLRAGENQTTAVQADEPRIVDLFDAMNAGEVEVVYIGKNAHEATVKFTNPGKAPIHLRLPEAFAAVPVLAQQGGFGGGGGGGGLGGGGGGGGNQGGGGGFGGGGGGGLGGGGGGGFFSVAPEKTRKVKVATLCLDHGLEDPNPRVEYELRPISDYVDRPEVVEMIKAFGRGELPTNAAQAAIWHLNNDVTWDQLAAKMRGPSDPRFGEQAPYFSRRELMIAVAIATEAKRIADENPHSGSNSTDPGKQNSASR